MGSSTTDAWAQHVHWVQTLVMHAEQWVAKFSLLLHEIAIQELQSLYDYFKSNTERLRVTPSTLDGLAQVVNLQSSLDADQPNITARFELLHSMFAILGKV
ncbi:MAG: hypothetical protein HC852_18985 [Acaryochloridaceae cyanobacterium RU_4_10]|nr:hypothetical protein [Acaryochloridaceae cyanobacterium RU_4_10]